MKCGRLLPLLLSLLLSVSLLAPAALARETEFFPDFPEPVPASAQDWSPADPSSFDAARQALLTAVRGEDASERSVLSLLSRMTDRFNELLTEYYFCSLDYMRSPTSCTQEYVRYSSVCGQAESDYLSAVQEVLNSAYGSVLAGLLGEGQAQSLLSTSPNTREELALLERETALVNEYWEAVVQEPSVQSGGRTWTRAQADAAYLVGSLEEDAYLTLVGYGMGIIPMHEVIMILTRVSLLANWFYNSWDQYTSAFVFGRRVSLALAGKRYDWDDRDLKAIIPLLREKDSNYIMHPIAFGITDYQRQNYSLRFRLVRDGEVLDEHHNKVSEKVIEENIHGLEARQGSFFTIVPNMMLMETNQMVIAKMADEAPKAESGEENGQDEQAPQGPVYLVELQFPKKKFVLACAHLFTEEQAVEIAKDYCIHFRLPNISDWQSLTRTWEEVRASQSGEETTDSFDTPAQEQDGQDAGQAEEEEKTSEGGVEESAAQE